MSMINLRQPTPRISFGSAESRRAWEQKAERLRAEGARRGFSHVVSPMCTVRAQGTVLTEGSQVTLAHLEGGDTPAWKRLRDLVADGHVLECYSVAQPPEPPAAA